MSSDHNSSAGNPSQVLATLQQTRRSGPIAHLPNWPDYSAAAVEVAIKQLVDDCAQGFAMLEGTIDPDQTPAWETLMDPLEAIENALGAIVGPVNHLTSVKYTDELQAAYDAVRPDVIELSNTMSQSQTLYGAMKALLASPEGQSSSAARQRILQESIRGMERSGVHLEGKERARFQEIKASLAELSNDFQTNLVKEEKEARVLVSARNELEGVPDAVIAMARKQAEDDGMSGDDAAGPWSFVVNAVGYMGVIQHGKHRGLRERFYRAFRSRGQSPEFDNREVLQDILRLRQEQAQLVGFDNYARLSIDSKMAPSLESVWEMLDELERAARPAAEVEFDELKAFMADQKAEGASDPKPWDVAFWAERLQEAKYSYDAEALRDYFQLPRVLDGLFGLVTKLYDVDIVESTDPEVPVWDSSVQFFEVRKNNTPIAGFYVDPYARPGEKRGGAWMNTVVGKSRLLAVDKQSASLPVALFVMNARPPAKGRPGLMSLDEVRTLFHEFGHATQHMFTQVDEGGASGMNLVEWDSVELASQFNEYWMEHKPFLRNLSAHVDSNEPLDDATIDRILASKNFMVGNGTLRQLLFAKMDLRMHERFGLNGSEDPKDKEGSKAEQSPFDIERELAQETVITPMLDDESQLPAFGHLFAGGYAAGYYSYKWAEVLAADAFAAFREVGLDNDAPVREVAQRFAETVLGLGGSQPAAEVYRLFRGRDASVQALLADQGLATGGAA